MRTLPYFLLISLVIPLYCDFYVYQESNKCSEEVREILKETK